MHTVVILYSLSNDLKQLKVGCITYICRMLVFSAHKHTLLLLRSVALFFFFFHSVHISMILIHDSFLIQTYYKQPVYTIRAPVL